MPILQTYPSIKVWVAGCSSGEELWSLAVLFAEEKIADRTVFYATDINAEALRAAENGIYPLERMAGFSPNFSQNYLAAGGRRSLSDYYHAAYGAAKFLQTLKLRVVFADHSLTTDSVFLEAHLVSCRNVLIYSIARCRIAHWVFSAIRSCGAVFSGWAARRVCGFRSMPTASRISIRASGFIRRCER